MPLTKQAEDYRRFLDPATASKLGTFELRSKFIVEGFLLGLHKSPFHGFSIEFSQHRPYMQGDGVKDIDWKVYGKTDKFFIKQYEDETNLRCTIFLDSSSSMNFRHSGEVTKYEYSAMLASALSYMALRQKDAAGITLYAETIKKYLPPKASSVYLTEILKAVAETPVSDRTKTAACLRNAAETIPNRGLVIVISDFLDDPDEVIQALKFFRFKKNEVIVFQILDPVEQSFSFGKDALFVDMESNEEMISRPYQIQKTYQDAFSVFLKKIKTECLNNGISYNLITTDQKFDTALFAFLKKRSKTHG